MKTTRTSRWPFMACSVALACVALALAEASGEAKYRQAAEAVAVREGNLETLAGDVQNRKRAVAGALPMGAQSSGMTKKEVLGLMRQVADWQLNHPGKHPAGDWINGPFWNGLMALGRIPGCEIYLDKVADLGKQEQWRVISTHWKANDHCTPQSWLELYELRGNPEMLQPTRAALDEVMRITAEQDDDLRFTRGNNYKWSWCDALYMAPPTFARLAKITGEKKYLEYLHQWWWKVSAFYYDPAERLYFRDHTFIPKRERNGAKVFWSRGNGWVIGGLVRVLEYLPKEDPMRARYERQLQEMLTRLAEIQSEDGLWRSGLLDPESYAGAETSGSAFFLFGFAYGINQGLLERKKFLPVAAKAWAGLARYVEEDGRFSGVQPVDDVPREYDRKMCMPYGTGAFLLAASEMYRLADKP